MKRKKLYITLSIIIVSLVVIGALLVYKTITPAYPYVKEYIVGTDNIKGEVNVEYFLNKNKNFEIGANELGYAVFKNPIKAFKILKEEYKDGIKLIKKEFKLLPLSQFNYKKYSSYGCQVTTGTNEEQSEARFVCAFMDIYENSYK